MCEELSLPGRPSKRGRIKWYRATVCSVEVRGWAKRQVSHQEVWHLEAYFLLPGTCFIQVQWRVTLQTGSLDWVARYHDTHPWKKLRHSQLICITMQSGDQRGGNLSIWSTAGERVKNGETLAKNGGHANVFASAIWQCSYTRYFGLIFVQWEEVEMSIFRYFMSKWQEILQPY